VTVQFAHGVLCVSHLVVLDEGEARRLARDPHAAQRAIPLEVITQIALGDLGVQPPDVQTSL
jgi:hypothetical protein